MATLGHPPTPALVLEVANALRDNRLLTDTVKIFPQINALTPSWLAKFKERHDERIAGVWSRHLNTTRLHAESIEKLAPWFAQVGQMMEQHRYKPHNIFNMEETGYSMGTSISMHVLTVKNGPKKVREAKKVNSGRGEWVSTVECITAAGTYLHPFIIFNGETVLNSSVVPNGIGNDRMGMHDFEQGMVEQYARSRVVSQAVRGRDAMRCVRTSSTYPGRSRKPCDR